MTDLFDLLAGSLQEDTYTALLDGGGFYRARRLPRLMSWIHGAQQTAKAEPRGGCALCTGPRPEGWLWRIKAGLKSVCTTDRP